MKAVRRREYRGPELDGNIFDWLVEETERIRYWGAHRPTQDPIPPVSLRSLRGNNLHHAARAILNAQEPRPHSPRENTFEITKARKL